MTGSTQHPFESDCVSLSADASNESACQLDNDTSDKYSDIINASLGNASTFAPGSSSILGKGTDYSLPDNPFSLELSSSTGSFSSENYQNSQERRCSIETVNHHELAPKSQGSCASSHDSYSEQPPSGTAMIEMQELESGSKCNELKSCRAIDEDNAEGSHVRWNTTDAHSMVEDVPSENYEMGFRCTEQQVDVEMGAPGSSRASCSGSADADTRGIEGKKIDLDSYLHAQYDYPEHFVEPEENQIDPHEESAPTSQEDVHSIDDHLRLFRQLYQGRGPTISALHPVDDNAYHSFSDTCDPLLGVW